MRYEHTHPKKMTARRGARFPPLPCAAGQPFAATLAAAKETDFYNFR
jgi:hypothetical protein